MDLLNKRAKQKESILKGKYIQEVLREEAQNLDDAMLEKMGGFSRESKRGRSMQTEKDSLRYQHLARHRFIDMKKRAGKKKKKSHPVHNRPIYGILPNIISRLSYGFTEETKQKMATLHGQEM